MMFVISKLFTYLCLPPGIFIIILFLSAFFAKRFKFFFLISAIIFYLLSIRPVANMLIHPLENIKTSQKIAPYVVVLGGGVNPKGVFKATDDAFKREIYGLLIAKKYNIPFIFTGGGIKYKEADEIQKDIEKIEKICGCKIKTYYESKSLNTYQNAKFTAKLFKKLGFKKYIFLVTSAYHMKRAEILFRYFGFKVIPKPVGKRYEPISNIFNFFPNIHDFKTSYLALHEYFGILSLKLRGI